MPPTNSQHPHAAPSGIRTQLCSLAQADEFLRSQNKGGLQPAWRLRYTDRYGNLQEPDHLDWEIANPGFGRVFSTIHFRSEAGQTTLGWDQYAITEGPSDQPTADWGKPDSRPPGAVVVPFLRLPNSKEPLVAFVRRGRPHVVGPPNRTDPDTGFWFLEVPRGFNSGVSEAAVSAALRELLEEMGNTPTFENFGALHVTGPRAIAYMNPNTAFYTSTIAVYSCELTIDLRYDDQPQFQPDPLEATLLKKGRLLRPSMWFQSHARDRGMPGEPAVVACGITAAALWLFQASMNK